MHRRFDRSVPVSRVKSIVFFMASRSTHLCFYTTVKNLEFFKKFFCSQIAVRYLYLSSVFVGLVSRPIFFIACSSINRVLGKIL